MNSRKYMWILVTVLFILDTSIIECKDATISIPSKDLRLQVDHNGTVLIEAENVPNVANLELMLWPQHKDIISVKPEKINIPEGNNNFTLNIHATGAGHSELTGNTTNNITNVDDVFLRVTVYKIDAIDTFSTIVGWIYFVAWSISFYPQIYTNWKRKSVVGLNFDFQGLNIMGFVLYSLFNLGLYAIPEIKAEYQYRYPRGLNPVQINDIVFAVHAAFACLITITQCFIYESAEQRVSHTAKGILSVFTGILFITLILSACNLVHWLDFLYVCSYVKLSITLIKYVPQAYMNYKRKSTVGWSIGNIFLDFTGGILSMLQMMLLAYNYDDWVSIFGDPTKFGLGLFSVIFDIFFIIQHYVLYKHNNTEINTNENTNNTITTKTKSADFNGTALCNDDPNGNVPLGKSCNRYWQCQGGYPRLQRCPAMLVFDRRSLRCVVPPTEDCDVPTTPIPPQQLEEEENLPGKSGGGGRQEFPNLPPGAIPLPLKNNKARN